MSATFSFTRTRITILLTLLMAGFVFTNSAHAQGTVLYINDSENALSPNESALGLRANYPVYTIQDHFSQPLSNVSELRVPIAKYNSGANGCAYSKFAVYEDGIEVYATEENFDINYLYFEDSSYNYTNDTNQWSSFRIEPPLNFNATSTYEFKFESGTFYCYYGFLEVGDGLPRLLIRDKTVNGYVTKPKPGYNALYALLGNNSVPTFALTDQVTAEGNQLSFHATATDPDGDILTYSADGLPAGASYDSDTGLFAWTPDYDQAGSYDVTFTATDDGDPILSASTTVVIVVENTNRAPVLDAIGDQDVSEGQTLQFTVSATDLDDNTLTYTAANLPSGATFVDQTFTWTPGYDTAGNYPDIEFTVMDDGSPMELDVELITITVGNVNRAPAIDNPGPQEVLETETLSFEVTATDPDDDAVVVMATDLPSGTTFDGTTFTWTPTLNDEGVYTVTFTATDNGTPIETSELSVVITVGDNPTPTEQAEDLVEDVVNLNLPQNLENSYLANLHKVAQFIEDGKINAALNQLGAFLQKLDQDYVQNEIADPDYSVLKAAGEQLVLDLQ